MKSCLLEINNKYYFMFSLHTKTSKNGIIFQILNFFFIEMLFYFAAENTSIVFQATVVVVHTSKQIID